MTGLRLFVLGMAFTVALLTGPPPSGAQEGDAAPPPPCSSKEVSQFDFWIGEWNLTWADNQGGYLDFVGGMEGDRMILSRTAENEGQKIHQRMVWYDIHHDQFDWSWERSTDGGKEWQVLWKIHYFRKSDG